MVLRSGLWAMTQKHKINAVVANQTITYRKSLKRGDVFTLETRVAGVDERASYFEQRFTVDGEIYAEATVRMRFVKRGGGTVPIRQILEWTGPAPQDRLLPTWMQEWTTSTGLPSTREPAPSTWA